MKQPFDLGVTGPTGAGKSTLCEIFNKLGCVVIDADKVSHSVVEAGKPALKALHETFPENMFNEDGTMNRQAMAKAAFSDKTILEKLQNIVFPYIIDELTAQAEENRKQARAVILDAPTLFESGCDKLCKDTASVVAPSAIRLERIISRDGLSKEDAKRRMQAQPNEDWYLLQAHHHFDGSYTIEKLMHQAEALLKTLGY